MVTTCVVWGCTNRKIPRQKGLPNNSRYRSEDITFHQLPNKDKKPDLFKKWVDAIRRYRDKYTPRHNHCVCSEHFKPDDYDDSGFLRKIKPGRFPTVFNNVPNHLKKKEKAPRRSLVGRQSLAVQSTEDLSKVIMPRQIPLEMAEALIAAIQKRECLYDTMSADYKNRHISELAWKDVADELRRDVHFCKTTWSTLRSVFNRKLAQLSNLPDGSAADHQPKWRFFQQLLFLKDHVSHGKMLGNVDLYPEEQDALNSNNNISSSSSSNTSNAEPEFLIQIKKDPMDMNENNEMPSAPIEEAFADNATCSSGVSGSASPTHSHSINGTGSSIRGRKRKNVTSEDSEDPVQEAVLHYISSKMQNSDTAIDINDDMTSLQGLLPFYKDLTLQKKMKFIHFATGFLMELHEND